MASLFCSMISTLPGGLSYRACGKPATEQYPLHGGAAFLQDLSLFFHISLMSLLSCDPGRPTADSTSAELSGNLCLFL